MFPNFTSKKFIKNLLKEKGIRPSKRMGQNFLVRRTVLRKIIESSDLKPEDTVLEIGSGIGTLTGELAQRVSKVIAVEKDKKLIEILKETLKDFHNIEIIPGDILKINSQLSIFNFQSSTNFQFSKKYKVVANLPYSIATEVIKRFLEVENPPTLMVLMVQKEVGRRICSEPPKMERLGVLVQVLAKVKISGIVKKDSFWPRPKVDSVILRITRIHPDKKTDIDRFSKIVKAGFSHPRKQLINNFLGSLNLPRRKVESWLLKNNIQPTQRAESLNLNDWLSLTKTFK